MLTTTYLVISWLLQFFIAQAAYRAPAGGSTHFLRFVLSALAAFGAVVLARHLEVF